MRKAIHLHAVAMLLAFSQIAFCAGSAGAGNSGGDDRMREWREARRICEEALRGVTDDETIRKICNEYLAPLIPKQPYEIERIIRIWPGGGYTID